MHIPSLFFLQIILKTSCVKQQVHTALLFPSLVEKYFTTVQAKVDWSKETAPEVNLNPQVKRARMGDMQQQTGSKSGKQYVKAVYCHLACLTYMQSVKASVARLCLPLQSHGLQPARLLCPQNSLGENTGVCCHTFLQGIFPTEGLNLGFLHFRQILYHLSHQRSPICRAHHIKCRAG